MAHTLDTSIRYPDDATTTNTGNPVNATITANANATALAVGIIYANSTNGRTGTLTAGGQSMTQANATQKAATSPEGVAEVWYLEKPPTGSVSIAIPNPNSLGIKVVAATFIAGAGNTSVYDTANGANATAANVSLSVTTSANAAVFSIVAHGNQNCIANLTGDNATNLYKFDLGAWGGAAQYTVASGAGAKAMGYNAASDDYGTVCVAFTESSAVFATVSQTMGDCTANPDVTATSTAAADVTQQAGDLTPEITATGTTNADVTQTMDSCTIVATAEGPSVNKFNLSASTYIDAGGTANTTAQLTAPSGKTGANFGAGKISDDTNPLPSIDLTANQYTELEFCLSANAAVTTSHVYSFRITANGTVLDTYSLTPTWTIGETVSNATVDQTLEALTPTITAISTASADVTQTLESAAPTITATGTTTADVTQTMESAAPTVTAISTASADVTQTLESLAPTVTVTGTTNADVTQTMGDCTPDITATVTTPGEVSASVNAAMGDCTADLGITATVDVTADVTQAIEAASPTIAVTATTTADVTQTMAAATPTITVASTANADITQTMGSATPTVTTTVAVAALVAQTAANLTPTITATSGAPTLPFRLSASGYIAANAATATTGQLTPPSGKTVGADFQAGRISDDTNPLPSLDLVTSRYTELEWSLVSGSLVEGTTYSFRVTANGTPLDTYSATPTWAVLAERFAAVAQTMGDCTIVAEGWVYTDAPRFADVTQTMGDCTPDITTAVGGCQADVTQTMADMSMPQLAWDWTQSSGDPVTEWHVYQGRTSGQLTDALAVLADETARTAYVRDFAPDDGEWYAAMTAANPAGESALSNEVFYTVPVFSVEITAPTSWADVTQTMAPLTILAVARVLVSPTVAQTMAACTPAITTTVALPARVNAAMASLTPTMTTAVTVGADVTTTMGDATLAAPVLTTAAADVTQTMDGSSIAATALVYDTGRSAMVEQPMGDLTSAATVTVAWPERTADVTQTMDPLTIVATASAVTGESRFAWVDALIADATASADATVAVAALVDETLEDLGLAGEAFAGMSVERQSNVLLDGSSVRWRS